MTDIMSKVDQYILDILTDVSRQFAGRRISATTDATARAALQSAIESLQGEKERLAKELDAAQEEINCAESALEAFSCEFEAEVFNQGFECLGDFVQALWKASNGQRDALQGEVEQLKQEWNRFHHLLKNHGLHPGRTDDDLLAILEAALAKLDELQRQEPIGCGYVVKWERGTTPSTYETGHAQVLGVPVYAAPKALEPVGYTDNTGAAFAVKWSGALPPNLTLYAAPKALEPIQSFIASQESLTPEMQQALNSMPYTSTKAAKGTPPEEDVGADCTPNHNCNGRMVHLPDGEHCDHCGITKGTPT